MGNAGFYSIAIGFAIGVFTASLMPFSLPEIVLLPLFGFGFGLAWLWERRRAKVVLLSAISLFLFSFSFGYWRFTTHNKAMVIPYFDNQLNQTVTLTGVVSREPDKRQFSQRLYLKTATGTVLVLTDRYQPITYGDYLSVTGKLSQPTGFTTDLGREFNYPGYLKARGVNYMISFATVTVVEGGGGNPILVALFTFKQKFMKAVETVLPEPQAGLGEGLLLGVSQALGADLNTAFRKSGIIHIVVLSGYNVMIVAEAVIILLTFWFRPRVRLVISLVMIGGFAVLVGLGSTVVRASLMAALVLIARATGRHYAIVRSLALAALIMLIFNPHLLVFDPGFQLSFLATLSLIMLAPMIEKYLWFIPTSGQIREFVTATVATQIFVLPLLLYSIGEFSLVSVLVNVMVLPLVPPAMFLTFLTGLISLLSPILALSFGLIAHLILSYIIFIAETFSALPLASLQVVAFPFWLVPIIYSLIFLGYRRLKQRQDNLLLYTDNRIPLHRKTGYGDWKIEAKVINTD